MAGAYERGEIDSAKTAELFATRGGAGISLDDFKAGRRGKGGRFPVIGVPGLSLWVRPAKGGYSISWRLRLNRGGKETTKTERYRAADNGAEIGMTLREARAWAAEVRAAWADGRDLMQERRTARAATESKLPDTLAELFPIWAERFQAQGVYSAPNALQWIVSPFDRFVSPKLGALTPDEITPAQIAEVLTPLTTTVFSAIPKLRLHLEKFFEWTAREEIGKRAPEKANPATWYCLKNRMPPRKKWRASKHNPMCQNDDLPRLFQLMTERPAFNRPAVMALAFQILTATRIGNIGADGRKGADANFAVWEDIDTDAALWTIPAEKMKVDENGAHVIPLSTQALAILARLKRLGLGDCKAVFPNVRGGATYQQTIWQTLASLAEEDERRGGNGFKDDDGRRATPHGIARANFRTWGKESGFPDSTLEIALHHKKDVLGYDRAKLIEQRREIMQAWADFLFSECPPNWAEVE